MTTLAGSARADEPAPPARAAAGANDASTSAASRAWWARYEAARARMLKGEFAGAQQELEALLATAPTEADRKLAFEMARLCKSYCTIGAATPPAPPPPRPRARIRSTDELTLLYASSFLYGAGTGVWFLLQTQPDSAATATLPFAAITAAPVIAVATIDGYHKLKRGVPHAISAGLYLGLGEGLWLVGMEHARAGRIESQDPGTSIRWKPETVASVLWGGATLGAVLGGALGSSLVTTPGRVSFTASTTMWAGTLSGLTAGAILPENDYRSERAFFAGGIGYNVGLAGGLLFAGDVSPSVARVRLVDLLGLAGGLATSGMYLSLSRDADVRLGEGLAAAGAAAGLAAGWLVTAGMKKDEPDAAPPPVVVQPNITPVIGGATLGVSGML